MSILKSYHNLVNQLFSQIFIEPKFYQTITNKNLDEKEKINILQTNKLLDRLFIDAFNYKLIEEKRLNALTYCVAQKQFKLASYLLNKKGIDFEYEIKGEIVLDSLMRYIPIDSSSNEEFFKKLFSQKIELKNKNIYDNLFLVLSDASKESMISGFIQCFNIDLKKEFKSFSNVFDFIEFKSYVSGHAIKAILNSDQFTKEELEKKLSHLNPRNRSDETIELIKDKIIDLIEKEAVYLENCLNQNSKIVNIKRKI